MPNPNLNQFRKIVFKDLFYLHWCNIVIKELQDTFSYKIKIKQPLLSKIQGRILVHCLSISLIYLLWTVYSIIKTDMLQMTAWIVDVHLHGRTCLNRY